MSEDFNNGNNPEGKDIPNATEQAALEDQKQDSQVEQPKEAAADMAANQDNSVQSVSDSENSVEPAAPTEQLVQQTPPVAPAVSNVSVKRKELIVLPIISLVVSVITFLLACFAPIPIIYVIIAFLGIIYAVVSLIVNINRKKVLSIIALVLAGVVFLASGAVLFVRQADNHDKTEKISKSSDDESDDRDIDEDDDDDEVDSTDPKDYIADSSDYKFNWSKSKFKKLKFAGYGSDSNKGDTLKSIIKKYGKAKNANMLDDRLRLEYKQENSKETIYSVLLTFKERSDGKFILESGNCIFNASDVKTNPNYKANLTRSDINSLKVGSLATGAGGTNLKDIIAKYGAPKEARITLSNYGNKLDKLLTVIYSDYHRSDRSKLDYAALHFRQQRNGDYLLINKYPR
ncbi:hypothetical protein [Streptococcus macacae]|uniref:CD20-like family protein n=1 Tax=Streptococcus macacae NCTC 11558 TaxID=764298 RepID=G5JWD5_9STRE|nr:hypothetical protein [Streptococcus macacae]EHJ52263.1 hypothetical protein STRMA_1881 [Streptococcus macacae NCTC 11558]SUN77789.1 Predicted permeases [Streptococcus macacae NCTC 11558]